MGENQIQNQIKPRQPGQSIFQVRVSCEAHVERFRVRDALERIYGVGSVDVVEVDVPGTSCEQVQALWKKIDEPHPDYNSVGEHVLDLAETVDQMRSEIMRLEEVVAQLGRPV